jgi:putative DNA primase/helicase
VRIRDRGSRPWAEVRIKQLTGADTIRARFMRQDFFSYRPQFKLTITGNHKPILQNVDEAVTRRINMVPFLHKPTVVDKQLESKLRGEWPAILKWMIDGCLDWQKNGLVRSQAVLDATAQYFKDQNTLQQWVDECCACRRDYVDTNGSLFFSWTNFIKSRGEEAGSQKRFRAALERLGFTHIKDTHGIWGRGFRGLRVSTSGPLGADV